MKTTVRLTLHALALTCLLAGTSPASADLTITLSTPVFYRELEPHGSWFVMDPYGWVWQPAGLPFSTGWRPYCNGGSWLWTDFGWYWNSSYAWGSIPFHFGWWVLSDNGWVWVPGAYWAPAWVCWRYSPGFYGWAPLPPPAAPGAYLGMGFDSGGVSFGVSVSLTDAHYVFAAGDSICEPSIETRTVPPAEVAAVYANSTPCSDFGAVRDRITTALADRPRVSPSLPDRYDTLRGNTARPTLASVVARADQFTARGLPQPSPTPVALRVAVSRQPREAVSARAYQIAAGNAPQYVNAVRRVDAAMTTRRSGTSASAAAAPTAPATAQSAPSPLSLKAQAIRERVNSFATSDRTSGVDR